MMLTNIGEPGFIKDPKTGVVINNNLHEYQSYVAERKRIQDLKSMNDEITSIKTDMSSIRHLLEKLIQGINKA